MNRPNPTVTHFYGLYIGKYKRQGLDRACQGRQVDCVIGALTQSIFSHVSNFCYLNLEQFGNYAFFDNVIISVIFIRFFIITFDWNGSFEFRWIHLKDLSEYILFQLQKYFFIYKNSFLGENDLFLFFFMQFLSNYFQGLAIS